MRKKIVAYPGTKFFKFYTNIIYFKKNCIIDGIFESIKVYPETYIFNVC